MNKLGLIKYILILIVTVLFVYFIAITTSIQNALITFVLLFIFALTIFMFSNRNKIKKNKTIYNIILMLLMAYFIVLLAFYLYARISCFFDTNCMNDFEADNIYLFTFLSSTMLLFSFKDIYTKTNKTNDIVTIMVCSLIIVIYARYYLDLNFIHRISKDDIYYLQSYLYITQNYIYFNIMYIVTLLHKLVNNKTMNQS